jgi:hypothetical protein
MADFTKLAAFLDSFSKEDPNYDTACYIKSKIAEDIQDRGTVNNGEEDDLQDNEVTMSTPDQQTSDNYEGDLMAGAFNELDALNQIKEEKEEIQIPDKSTSQDNKSMEAATLEAFGDNTENRKEASLFSLLQKRIKR